MKEFFIGAALGLIIAAVMPIGCFLVWEYMDWVWDWWRSWSRI
jgi:hypothetical protein